MKGSLTEDNVNKFKYLVMNVSWLRHHGLDKFGESDNLKLTDIPDVLQYINGLLARASQSIFHAKVQDVYEGEQKVATSYGNVLFLLNQRWVIPVSVMMEGVKQAWNATNQAMTSGVGYFKNNELSVRDKIKVEKNGTETRRINLNNLVNFGATEFQREKRDNYLVDLPDRANGLTYSGDLLQYGSEKGQDYIKGTTININYTFIMENLRGILKQFQLY